MSSKITNMGHIRMNSCSFASNSTKYFSDIDQLERYLSPFGCNCTHLFIPDEEVKTQPYKPIKALINDTAHSQ